MRYGIMSSSNEKKSFFRNIISKISKMRNLRYANKQFKHMLEEIIDKNLQQEYFKTNAITVIEDDPKLDLELDEEYINNTLLSKYYEYNTTRLPWGMNKLIFENNLYKEIIRDLFTNTEVFEAYKRIIDMNLVDNEYYNEKYDYSLSVPPILHFLYRGYNEGKNPSSYFDCDFYQEYNENAGNSELNPIVYFVLTGVDEGLVKINRDFYAPRAINKLELKDKIENYKEYGLTIDKRKKQLIVSFTSYPLRMNELHYTIYSLVNQELKPDKLLLWLSYEEFPNLEDDIPESVLRFKDHGLEIRWCNNIYSYKKLIPTLSEYPNDIIVTVDDDVFYPRNWLKKLFETHTKNPKEIIVHRARNMKLIDNYMFKEYTSWDLIKEESEHSYLTFMTGAGGILYPPESLHEYVFNQEQFLDLCRYGDDIWFWAMAILNRTKFKVVDDPFYDLIYINPAREVHLIKEETLWSNNRQGSNDRQLKAVIKHFPEIMKIIQENDENS